MNENKAAVARELSGTAELVYHYCRYWDLTSGMRDLVLKIVTITSPLVRRRTDKPRLHVRSQYLSPF